MKKLERRYSTLATALAALALGVSSLPGAAVAAPTLYRNPQHGSPVRAHPGDLLLIPGRNFASKSYVVYKAVANTTMVISAPSPLPTGQTATSGKIDPLVIPTSDDPAIKVRLPSVMTKG